MVLPRFVMAALAVATCYSVEVKAEVIHGGPRPRRDNGWVDMDENGTRDFSVSSIMEIPLPGQPDIHHFYIAPQRELFSENSVLASDEYGNVSPVAAGLLIDWNPQAPMNWFLNNGSIALGIDDMWGVPWTTDPIGILGVRFASDEGIHFGWIRVRVETWTEHTTTESGLPIQITHGPEVIDWAYESTPGAAIVAGAVPEAGTVVLVVVGAVTAFMLGWRRRHLASR